MGKIFHQHVAARAPRRDGVEKYAGEIVCWWRIVKVHGPEMKKVEIISNLESRLGHVKSTNNDLEKFLHASQDDNRLLHANLSRLISDLEMTKQSNK